MEREKIVSSDIITREIITYVSDVICLNFAKQNSNMSSEDYEHEMERFRGNRDMLIYYHAIGHLRDLELEGLRVQAVSIMENDGRLSESFAYRYLKKTGFLGAVESSFVNQENNNF